MSAFEQIGLLYQMWAERSVTTSELIERSLVEFDAAAGLGYGSIWIGEHHLASPERRFGGRVPIPELLAVHAAARTEGIRFGTGVKVLPAVPAQRAAEELALTDLLTHGRADFGVGQGTGAASETERRTRQQAFRERLDDVLRYLRGDTSTGLPLLNVQPVSDPASNLWAACRDEASIEFVALRGLNYVVGQAENLHSQAGLVDRFRAAGATGSVRGVRAVYVAENEQVALREFADAFDLYGSVFTSEDASGSRYVDEAIRAGHLPAKARTVAESLQRANLIVGGPSEVAAQLRDYVEVTKVDRLDVMLQFPGLDGAHTLRSLELFSHEVRPQLAVVAA